MVLTDVVESILIRCDTSDLLRCKSVCKPWYGMISSSYFAKTHAKFVCGKEEDNSNRKIAMITSFIDWSDSDLSKYFPLPPGWGYYGVWSLGGSSNGLICLHSRYYNRLIVSNPVTREFREILLQPKVPKEIRCLGFGYDSLSDDFKVVFALCEQDGDHALVSILALKSNVWKNCGQVNYRFDDMLLVRPGILVNGKLFWFWLNPNDATRLNILLVSFDLAKEEFIEIPQPVDSKYIWNYGCILGTIKGRLCICPTFKNKKEDVGIWIMESENSWELFPKGREIEDYVVHYMLKDTDEYRVTPPPSYYCADNTELTRSKEHIPSPMFVQTLVCPYAAGSIQYQAFKIKEARKADTKLTLTKPERPPSPFSIFMEGFSKQFKEKNPTNNSVAVVDKAGKKIWKSMLDADKGYFIAKAEQRMKDYNKKLAACTNDEENDSDKSKSEVNDDSSDEEEDDE